jgi:3-methylfumaryl-CoA hydratase
MTTSLSTAELEAWVGREERRADVADPFRVQALEAVLDRFPLPQAEAVLPPAWHWLCFLPLHRQIESGVDGHPARGGFLPPVALPRRMWAGSRIQFHAPLWVGDAIERRSVIESVKGKSGRSGELVFVTVRHEISQQGAVGVTEWQDIVYRGEADAAKAPASPPAQAQAPASAEPPALPWNDTRVPDEALLFRFSALTFNAHRIHYDRDYASRVEGYPDLVVHGPLQAILLLDLLHRKLPQAELREFSFRGVSPAFCGRALSLAGGVEAGQARLLARDDQGRITMEASAVLAE